MGRNRIVTWAAGGGIVGAIVGLLIGTAIGGVGIAAGGGAHALYLWLVAAIVGAAVGYHFGKVRTLRSRNT